MKKILGITNFTKEDYGFLCVYLVAFVPLIYKFISPFFILAGLGSLTIIINPVIMTTGLIIIRKHFRRCIKIQDIVVFIIAACLLALTPVMYPDNNILFKENYVDFVCFTMSFYFIGLTIDYSRHCNIISAVARIGVWLNIFLQALVFVGIIETSHGSASSFGEQMGYAYKLLFCNLVLFMDLAKRFNLQNFIYFSIATILLLFMGTRGPVLIFSVFIIVYLLIFHKFHKFNLLKKGLVVCILSVFNYYLELIMMALIPIVSKLGFSTRVFESIIDFRMIDMSDSSDRDVIWSKLIDAIRDDSSGLGYGWLGDRILLDNLYSHNFELEILTQFGVLFGGLFLILMIILIFRSYFKIRFSDSREFWLVMFFVGLVALQLSNTYVNAPLFFIMIGYFISLKRGVSH